MSFVLLLLAASFLSAIHCHPQSHHIVEQQQKCNDATLLDEFVQKQVKCVAEADMAEMEAVMTDNIRTTEDRGVVVCNAITAKAKCILDLVPSCFTPTQTKELLHRFLRAELEKKSQDVNLQKPFQKFVDSCPVLKIEEEEEEKKEA